MNGDGTKPIPHHIRENFKTMNRAAKAGGDNFCLLSAVRRADKVPVYLVCGLNWEGETAEFVPLAEMIDGDPYELYDPPQ